MPSKFDEELAEFLNKVQSMVNISWFDTPYLLMKGCINAILCNDPHIRTTLTRNIVYKTLERDELVVYIDLDTMFTISLEFEKLQAQNLDNLVISNPDDSNIDYIIAEVSSLNFPNLGLVVFDSINTFYHIFPSDVNYGKLNQKLGIYLFLLKKLAIRLNTRILILSLLRAKKVLNSWIYSYAGGRVLNKMGDVIITLSKINNQVEIKLLKHPNKGLEGKAFFLSL
ncbi:MAG: hypothetical protein QW372_03205 [Nitrososphaerales archaeon]